MNNELLEILKKRDIHPIGYQKIGKGLLIKDREHNYFLKLNTSNYDIYKYLSSRDFFNYPKNYNEIGDNFDLSEYISNIKVEKDQKLNDLLELIAILHKKTLYKREFDLDDIKKIYEELNNVINYRLDYYIKLNDKCDNEEFLSPSMYLLMRNISLIYYMLEGARKNLNIWYEKIKNNKSIRVCLLHNNISLDHLIINRKKYLINWDKAMFDNPINDLLSFYKLYYKDLSLNDVFFIYEKNNSLEELEKDLLIIYLMVGNDVKISDNELLNTKLINNELIYLENVYNYIKKNIEMKKS